MSNTQSSAVLNTSNNSVWFAGKRHFYTCFESAQVAQRKFNKSIGFAPVVPKPIATEVKSTTRDEDALAYAKQMDERTDEWYESEMEFLTYNKANNLDQFGNAKEGECNAPDGPDGDYDEVANSFMPNEINRLKDRISHSGNDLLLAIDALKNNRRDSKKYKQAFADIADIAQQMHDIK